jgi:hypothetical protein
LFQQTTYGAYEQQMANKALHLTAIPLRSIAAGELGVVSQRAQAAVVVGKGARMKMCKPFAKLRSAIERDTMVSKEPQPVHAL